MLHELRIYTYLPLKQEEVVEQMKQLMPLFEKYEIKVVGVWTTLIGRRENFVYMLEWESLAEREKKHNAFRADPALQKALDDFGPVTQYHDYSILVPTEYSPMR